MCVRGANEMGIFRENRNKVEIFKENEILYNRPRKQAPQTDQQLHLK